MRWPPLFTSFLEAFDHVTLEVFDLVPAECALGRSLSYVVELVATLVTPVLLMLVVLVLAAAVALLKCQARCSLRGLLRWPQVWDLQMWLILIQYPTISRKTMGLFDCVPFESGALLRADPTLSCNGTNWLLWSAVAAGGILVYCLGVPFAVWLVSRRLHQGSPAARRLVRVLTRTYTERCWFMESIDLLRKFLLTGVVTLVLPQSKVQLWFGTVVSQIAMLLQLRVAPFREPVCNHVQLAVHAQLLFTYLTAGLFFVDDLSSAEYSLTSDDTLGMAMIAANCVAFIFVLFAGLKGLHGVAAAMTQTHLAYASGEPVVLRPSQAHDGYHIFISHVWRFAQDQAGTIKTLLQSLVPTCHAFLDVDDLEDVSLLEAYVDRADVVLIFITEKYLSSFNCRRELVAALRARKPLLLMLESDPDKGATNAVQLRAEVDLLERAGTSHDHCRAAATLATLVAQHSGAPDVTPIEARFSTSGLSSGARLSSRLSSSDVGGAVALISPLMVIEWHREKELKHAAIKSIVASLLREQYAPSSARVVSDPLTLCIREQIAGRTASHQHTVHGASSSTHATVATHRAHATRQTVFLCAAYRELPCSCWNTDGLTSAFDEILKRLDTAGIAVVDDKEVAARLQLPVVLFLCPVWTLDRT